MGDLSLPEGVIAEGDPEDPIAVGMITRSTLESIAADEAAVLAAEEGGEGIAFTEDGDSGGQEGGAGGDSEGAAEDG